MLAHVAPHFRGELPGRKPFKLVVKGGKMTKLRTAPKDRWLRLKFPAPLRGAETTGRPCHSVSPMNGAFGGCGPAWRSVSPFLVVASRRRIRKLIEQLRKIYGHLWPQLPPSQGLPVEPVGA